MSGLTWEGRPAERSPYDSVRLRALVILGGVGAALVLSVFAAIFALTRTDEPVEFEEYTPPLGTGVAAAVMDAWVSGRQLSIPTAPVAGGDQMISVLSQGSLGGARWWESGVDTTAYAGARGGFVTVELHRFTMVVGGNAEAPGRTYTVTVPVSIQEGNVPIPAGPPVVGPYEEYQGNIIPAKWENAYERAPLSDAARGRINEWVQAYFSDNRAALANIAGTQGGDYRGITGFAVEGEPRIVESVTPVAPTDYVVRIQVPVKSGEFSTVMFMELIVIDDGNTAPRVVAWGGVGEGAQLLANVDSFTQPDTAPAQTEDTIEE